MSLEQYNSGDSDLRILAKILQNQGGPYPYNPGDSDVNILRKILMNQYDAEFVIPDATTTTDGVVRLSTIAEQRAYSPNGVITPNGQLNAYQTQQELFKGSSGDVISVVSRYLPNTTLTTVSGTVYLVPFVGIQGTISSVSISPEAGSSGLSLARVGIYTVSDWVNGANPNYTGSSLVASSGSFTSIPAMGSVTTVNLSTPYGMIVGQKYFASIIQVGTTPATLKSSAVQDTLTAGLAPQQCLVLAGQADLPASLTSINVGGTGTPAPRLYLNFTS
jgi:hypothetical protein